MDENQEYKSWKNHQNGEYYTPLVYCHNRQNPHRKKPKCKHQIVCYTKVKWARYLNKRKVVQCRRCQAFNHASNNCNRDPRCVKCGGEHITGDCDKAPKGTRIENPKCANCGGSHLANSQECEVYKKNTRKFKSKSETITVTNTKNKRHIQPR